MDKLDHNQSNWKAQHLPCDACGSSDGVSVNIDNSWKCFSCKTHGQNYDNEYIGEQMTESKLSAIRTEGVAGALTDRKITSDTTKKYGVTIRRNNDGSIKNHLYPYYKDGEQVAQKIRDVQDKDFRIEGTVRDAELFGMHTVQKKGKYITITEGECDAMAAYELMGSKWAVVSVINGASSAPKDVKKNLEFFNDFETIVICFDADKAGKDAAKKVAELFPPSKAKIMTMPEGYKDANDMLKVNKKQTFMEA